MSNYELSTTLPLSRIDQDLRDLEDFTVDDKMEFLTDAMLGWGFARNLIEQGVATQTPPFPISQQHYKSPETVERSREPRPDGILFSVLPDIPHPLDHGKDIYTIRDVGQLHPDFYKTEAGAALIPVQQGYMVEVPSGIEQFYGMSMSTCSCIVGYGPEKTIVAHVSFSIEMEAAQVLDHMARNGVRPDDIFVVASQTPGVDEQMGFPVVTDASYYTQQGIPRENVFEFTHQFRDGVEDIVRVSVAPEAIRVAKYKATREKISKPYQVDVHHTK